MTYTRLPGQRAQRPACLLVLALLLALLSLAHLPGPAAAGAATETTEVVFLRPNTDPASRRAFSGKLLREDMCGPITAAAHVRATPVPGPAGPTAAPARPAIVTPVRRDGSFVFDSLDRQAAYILEVQGAGCLYPPWRVFPDAQALDAAPMVVQLRPTGLFRPFRARTSSWTLYGIATHPLMLSLGLPLGMMWLSSLIFNSMDVEEMRQAQAEMASLVRGSLGGGGTGTPPTPAIGPADAGPRPPAVLSQGPAVGLSAPRRRAGH
ncbi:hypothetical protein H696_02735 [Fonticula alba]|uniref:ER membrane protein complex subunit 7 beta-sandwich domain-containing protein n=1 Tax=Fonticula alba TaxID=691883 RepID=A0A058Z7Y0_FONAL|nr:hypothetical protein H696_02735 [Fonticula alba]KCV70399.1 hypothetical protein H696_02735 [Fonticula alba]|eukprot:XP_009494915.1 hypothetical protein H696_02735 [Fonticula alba]